jgi:hypothetical protein
MVTSNVSDVFVWCGSASVCVGLSLFVSVLCFGQRLVFALLACNQSKLILLPSKLN